ncbi:hypothetical protein BCV70DRAFT_201050 [Testicularia cyperi]|uniref:Uncharacterized protein n=1 Tax=Testicularia cyperi TaxID=1882483 RepID=A0A317XMF0_9BASI|nr:hypothetical protein BCV70DRAFT_201050 [Testicularia cyperi]
MRFFQRFLVIALLALTFVASSVAFTKHLLSTERPHFEGGVNKFWDTNSRFDFKVQLQAEDHSGEGLDHLQATLLQDRPNSNIYWENIKRPEFKISRVLPGSSGGELLKLGPDDMALAFWHIEGGNWLLRTVSTMTGASEKLSEIFVR